MNSMEPIIDTSCYFVHKFGGTSVGTPAAIEAVIEIVESTLLANLQDRVAVVVSAMGGKPKVVYF